MVVPELADNPCHPNHAGRGTHKGIKTCSPTDNEGRKLTGLSPYAHDFHPRARLGCRRLSPKGQQSVKLGTQTFSPKDDVGIKKPLRRNPTRSCCMTLQQQSTSSDKALTIPQYFPPLELEACNSDLYDTLHKTKK